MTALLRGPAGLRVDLQVADAAGHPRHVSLERRSLPQPPVKEVRPRLLLWMVFTAKCKRTSNAEPLQVLKEFLPRCRDRSPSRCKACTAGKTAAGRWQGGGLRPDTLLHVRDSARCAGRAAGGGGGRRGRLRHRPAQQPWCARQSLLALLHLWQCSAWKCAMQVGCKSLTPHAARLFAGGVFEEAIAIASLLLDANCPVAATVRTAGGFIDNSFQVQLSAVCCQCLNRLCIFMYALDHGFSVPATALQTGHLPTQIFQNLPGMHMQPACCTFMWHTRGRS